MISKFYCSKTLNKKTNEFEFRFKEAKKKDIIVFKTLDDAISHLKSLRRDATMWVRENEVFVSGIKVRVGDNPEEEVQVEIIKFEPKAKKAKPTPEIEEEVQEEPVVSFDEEECEECKLLEEDSKTWENVVETENEECAECKLMEQEEVVSAPKNGCTECSKEACGSTCSTKEVIELKEENKEFHCVECEAIESEIAKWDEEIISSSLEQEGNIFLLEEVNKKVVEEPIVETKPVVSTQPVIVENNSETNDSNNGHPCCCVNGLHNTKEQYEYFLKFTSPTKLHSEDSQYALVNKDSNTERPVNVIEMNAGFCFGGHPYMGGAVVPSNAKVGNYAATNDGVYYTDEPRVRESIWTRSNYVLWLLFWLFLIALIIIIIVVLFFGGYSNSR